MTTIEEAAEIAYWEKVQAEHDREREEYELEQFIERNYPDWVADQIADDVPLLLLYIEAFLDWASDEACAAAERRAEGDWH